MNIWLLTNDYPPQFGFGIGKYVYHAAKMYSNGGHQVSVFVQDPYQQTVTYEHKNLRVIRFSAGKDSAFQKLGCYLKNSYEIAEIVVKQIISDGQKPDIIEVQDCMALGYFILMKKLTGNQYLSAIPIIVHMHGPRFKLIETSQLLDTDLQDHLICHYEKICYQAADALLSPTGFMIKELEQYVSGQQVQAIPLPFELSDSSKDTAEKNIDILYVGRLEKRKGVVPFLEQMEIIWQQGAAYKVVLIGENTPLPGWNCSTADYIMERYDKYIKVGLLQIVPNVPENIVYNFLQQAKLLVLPALYDNFPLSCVEAMSHGVPVLVSKSGGQTEMVKETHKDVFIFDWAKQNDFREKLEILLKMNEPQLKKLGQEAAVYIGQICNYEINLQKRLAYFTKIVNQKRQSEIFPGLRQLSVNIQREKKKNNKLSVVIILDGSAEQAKITAASVLKNNYPSLEIIFIDCLNQKNEQNELRGIFNIPDSITVEIIAGENLWLERAKYMAAEKAKGSNIIFLKAGCEINSGYFRQAKQIINNYSNVGFVYSWQIYNGYCQEFINAELPFILLLKYQLTDVPILFNRALYLAAGDPDQSMAEIAGQEMLIRLVKQGLLGICIPEALCVYREAANSNKPFVLSSSAKIISYEKIIKKHIDIFNKYQKELLSIIYASFK